MCLTPTSIPYLVLNDVIINCHWSLGIPWLGLVVIWINLNQWIFQGWLSYHPSRTDPVSTIHAAYNTSVVVESQPGHILQSLFHNTGRRMIRMIEYLLTCSETIPGRIFTYTIWSSHHRFQVDRCVLVIWHQRSYSNDIQHWTGCHHFLEQTYQHSLDLYSPTVITHTGDWNYFSA